MHIQHVLHMLHIDVYSAIIATLSCRRSKRNAAADGLEGAQGRRRLRGVQGCGPAQVGAGQGSAKPWWTRMSLRAMKSVHEPVVVGLAGMVQEQPATRLAGMDLADIYINMQRICSYM